VQHFVNVNSIYVRVSIRVRGLHLVSFLWLIQAASRSRLKS
jgi:hypothetical protein